jgi:hypothetical protein
MRVAHPLRVGIVPIVRRPGEEVLHRRRIEGALSREVRGVLNRVAEHAADAALLEAAGQRIRHLGRRLQVAVIDDGGDARLDRLEASDVVGDIGGLGIEASGIDRAGLHHVLREGPVRRQAAQDALPDVAMAVDEPGQDDLSGSVHDLCARHVQGGTDRHDAISPHMDVALRKFPQALVHREDVAVADQQVLHRSSSPTVAALCCCR